MVKTAKPPGKRGPKGPRKTIDPLDVKRLEKLAAYLNDEQIADLFGMSADTFARRRDEDPEITRRYKRGKAKAIALAGENLLALVRKKNVAAIFFFLKTRAGWRERGELEVTDFNPDDFTDQQLEQIAAGVDIRKVRAGAALARRTSS